MRIEALQHAVNSVFDQLGVVRLLHILCSNAFQDLSKKVELLVNLCICSNGLIPASGLQYE